MDIKTGIENESKLDNKKINYRYQKQVFAGVLRKCMQQIGWTPCSEVVWAPGFKPAAPRITFILTDYAHWVMMAHFTWRHLPRVNLEWSDCLALAWLRHCEGQLCPPDSPWLRAAVVVCLWEPAHKLQASSLQGLWSSQFKGHSVCGWLTRSSMPPPNCRYIPRMFSFPPTEGWRGYSFFSHFVTHMNSFKQ